MVHALAYRLRKGMNLGLAETGFRIESFVAPLLETARRQGVARLQTGLKGEAIMRQGDAADTVFILETGLVKLVYSTAAGDEWIKSFIVDRGIFGSVDTGQLESPAVLAHSASRRATACFCRLRGRGRQSRPTPD